MTTLLLVRPENRQLADRQLCHSYGLSVLPFSPVRLVQNKQACRYLPEQLAQADAVFWVSPSAVEMAQAYFPLNLYRKIEHIAVGEATASALKRLGIKAHFSATGNDSEAASRLPIWQKLPAQANILIVRGEGGRAFLSEILQQQGFNIHYAEIYQRQTQALNWQDFEQHMPTVAWITSSEMVREMFDQVPLLLAQKLKSLLYFTHHQRIAQVLHQRGVMEVYVVSTLKDALNLLCNFPLLFMETPNDRTTK